MTLGERIKEAREKANISKSDLAKRLNVSPSYVCYLESGKKENPSFLIMQKINNILNADIFDIPNDGALRLVDLNLKGISPSDELQKVNEENKEFEMAVLECLCNPIEENKLHTIEEFWDKVQSSLSYLQITLGITANEVMEQYHLHLEKIKNRPR
ncbi:helix-turn-helix transcriptional regulator [Clostridium beijerinckii]|uniref:Helix-turn-helix transcriptional regulator n=1 Tax=Clostridium beijerinckii TaxID=1520 RepID=A0A7X9SQU0_CLOBE|nr:helix-turn-helix transcriptional regulator [Clostridium beijerinckii]NMF06279.1 helix-turn-helix transcriptional regulator [Clostridium beijerinckii]